MRVLLISQYFFPEVGATQTRMMEFARALTDAGHEVDVLTEFPNHPAGVIPDSYKAVSYTHLTLPTILRV